jgi:hypothetical protein
MREVAICSPVENRTERPGRRSHLEISRPGGNRVSTPSKIQFNFVKSFVRGVKSESRKTFHWTPMGTYREYLAAAPSVLDDAADDLILLYPLEPPNVPVNVIYIKLDSSHPSRSSTVDASGAKFSFN